MMKVKQGTTNGLHHEQLYETIDGDNRRPYGHWMEQVIEEARKRGDFDDLPGKGKPLNLDDGDPFGGLEAQVYKVLKNAGFAPEWIELRKQIVAEINWMREHPGHPERPSRIVECNSNIDRHNRQVPSGQLTLPKLPRDFCRE